MNKGTTRDELSFQDSQYYFRTQNNRSLDEIDILLKRQEFIKQKLGEENAAEIERNPDQFYNHQKFNIWQAKARFRAFIVTVFAVPITAVIMSRGKNGYGWMWRNWFISIPMIAGIYMTNFYIIHRAVGYSNFAYYEQQYAKNTKMIRNMIIRQ